MAANIVQSGNPVLMQSGIPNDYDAVWCVLSGRLLSAKISREMRAPLINSSG